MARNSGQWGGDPSIVYGKGWDDEQTGDRARRHVYAGDTGTGYSGALADGSTVAIGEDVRARGGSHRARHEKSRKPMITQTFELYSRDVINDKARLFELDGEGTVIWGGAYTSAANALIDLHTALANGASPCADGWAGIDRASAVYTWYMKTRVAFKGSCTRWDVRNDGIITVEFHR